MGLHAAFRRSPGGLGTQHLAHISFLAARLTGIKKVGGALHHELSSAHLGIGAGDGKLNTLVLADGAVEHRTLASVRTGLINKPARITYGLRANEDTFCVHTIQNVAKPFSLLTDQRVGGNAHVIEEDLRRRMVDHGADGLNLQPLSLEFADIDKEYRHTVVRPFSLIPGRRAGK